MARPTPETHSGIQLLNYLIALLINAFPLPQPVSFVLPPMALLMLFYWAQKSLSHTHFFAAVIMGLLYDTLNQTLLGTHALMFSTFLFVFLQIRLRFRLYGTLQQAILVMVFLYAYQLVYWLLFLPSPSTLPLTYWLMPFSTLVFWPLIRWLLDHLTAPLSQRA